MQNLLLLYNISMFEYKNDTPSQIVTKMDSLGRDSELICDFSNMQAPGPV